MKTTTINVGRIQVSMSAPPADARRAAADVARRVAAQIESRSGVRLPVAAASQIAGRLTRALTNGGRR